MTRLLRLALLGALSLCALVGCDTPSPPIEPVRIGMLVDFGSTGGPPSLNVANLVTKTLNEEGGLRYMLKIHQSVTEKTSPKVGGKLKAMWKGIGDWRA